MLPCEQRWLRLCFVSNCHGTCVLNGANASWQKKTYRFVGVFRFRLIRARSGQVAPSPSRAASFSKEPSDRQCSMRQASREAVFPSTPASSRSPSKKRWRPSVQMCIRDRVVEGPLGEAVLQGDARAARDEQPLTSPDRLVYVGRLLGAHVEQLGPGAPVEG